MENPGLSALPAAPVTHEMESRSLLFAPQVGTEALGSTVELRLSGEHLIVIGQTARWEFAISELRRRETFEQATAIIELPGGQGVIEIPATSPERELLARLTCTEDRIARWARSPRCVALSGLAMAAFLAFCYLIVLPPAAAFFARWLPVRYCEQIDQTILKSLDKSTLKPSRIPGERRERLSERFTNLKLPEGPVRPNGRTKLLFRDAGEKNINAFALPGGTIVVFDALAEHLSDDMLMAVLGHEIGHVAHQHSLRRLAHTSSVGFFFAIYVGDFSALAASSATYFEGLSYSRDAEREADQYAIATLLANGLSPRLGADFFGIFMKKEGDDIPTWLSTHPGHAERSAFFENAAKMAQ